MGWKYSVFSLGFGLFEILFLGEFVMAMSQDSRKCINESKINRQQLWCNIIIAQHVWWHHWPSFIHIYSKIHQFHHSWVTQHQSSSFITTNHHSLSPSSSSSNHLLCGLQNASFLRKCEPGSFWDCIPNCQAMKSGKSTLGMLESLELFSGPTWLFNIM